MAGVINAIVAALSIATATLGYAAYHPHSRRDGELRAAMVEEDDRRRAARRRAREAAEEADSSMLTPAQAAREDRKKMAPVVPLRPARKMQRRDQIAPSLTHVNGRRLPNPSSPEHIPFNALKSVSNKEEAERVVKQELNKVIRQHEFTVVGIDGLVRNAQNEYNRTASPVTKLPMNEKEYLDQIVEDIIEFIGDKAVLETSRESIINHFGLFSTKRTHFAYILHLIDSLLKYE